MPSLYWMHMSILYYMVLIQQVFIYIKHQKKLLSYFIKENLIVKTLPSSGFELINICPL